MSEFALEVRDLTKKYGDAVAVDNLSFNIREGEFFGFLGPNGAGKSSTIHCATGISTATSGNISVFGHDVVDEYRVARTMIGLSPQEFNVDIFAPTRNMLWFVLGFYGVPRSERKDRIEETLRSVDLVKHADKPFRALSGGLKRRAMLARAIVHRPKLLILDEPTAGIDVEFRRELWDYLRKINKEGTTILLTSHYLEEVELLCDRIGIVSQGRLVGLDTKEAFTSNGKKLEDEYLRLTKGEETSSSK